ncbi:MAG: hypothetical protein EOM20_09520 [Spartobacteria bacterium]|nr:hypothetical protein [Spartobacteria bacterium]
MNKYAWCVLLGLAMLLNVSCDSDDDDNEIVLTDVHSGSTVTLPVGREILIVLGSQPSTGYMWYLTRLDESVVSRNGESSFKADSDLIGAPGQERWPFKAVGVGQTQLRMEYRRSTGGPSEIMEINFVVE